MTRIVFSLVAVIVLIATSTFNLAGQTDPKKKDTFGVRANLLVVDEEDKRVESIKESDVKIFENGIEQKLTYFATKESPLNLAIVVDNTGSMRQQLEKVIGFSKLIVANLRLGDEATIIRFVGRDKVEVVQPWTNNGQALNGAIDNFFIEGGQSALIDALYLAGDELQKRRQTVKDRRYAIVLISDGEERNSRHKEEEVLTLVANTDIQIFSVILTELLSDTGGGPFNNKSKNWVEKMAIRLAAQTGGTAFIMGEKSKHEHYIDSLKRLILELRAQVVVGYTARDLKKDNLTRKLTATIADGPKGEKRKGMIKDTIVLPQDR